MVHSRPLRDRLHPQRQMTGPANSRPFRWRSPHNSRKHGGRARAALPPSATSEYIADDSRILDKASARIVCLITEPGRRTSQFTTCRTDGSVFLYGITITLAGTRSCGSRGTGSEVTFSVFLWLNPGSLCAHLEIAGWLIPSGGFIRLSFSPWRYSRATLRFFYLPPSPDTITNTDVTIMISNVTNKNVLSAGGSAT